MAARTRGRPRPRMPLPPPKRGWHEDNGVWTFYGERAQITVHRYVGFGDELFVSCYQLRIVQRSLGTDDPAAARLKALNVCQETVNAYVKDVSAALVALPSERDEKARNG